METHCPPTKTPSVTHDSNFEFFSISVMREVERATYLDSPKGLPRADSEDLPPYGAQYHQDALGKGEQSL